MARLSLLTSVIPLCVCGIIVGAKTTAGVKEGDDVIRMEFLYDLQVDPFEKNNIIGLSDYSERLIALKEVAQGALNEVEPNEDNYDYDAMIAAFTDAGGFAPWIENDHKRDVPLLYSYKDAPNVVLILVDDWGYNELGVQSTHQEWTMPYINEMTRSGIRFSNYYSHQYCMPARAALLTGRYGHKYGMHTMGHVTVDDGPRHELPLSVVTLGEEFQSAGYHTMAVGKWHMGFSSLSKYPRYRGFDYYYGFLEGGFHYTTKKTVMMDGLEFLDYFDGESLVNDSSTLSVDMYGAIDLQEKAEKAIITHAVNEKTNTQPLFLYYATPLVHSPYDEMPQHYMELCSDGSSHGREKCAMNRLLNEMVQNLSCVLQRYDMWNNTLFLMISDNGAVDTVPGSNYPFRGKKFDLWRGAQHVPAFLYSPNERIIPTGARGSVFAGMTHVTDWLPTLMHVATNGEWRPGAIDSNAPLPDGVNMYDAIVNNRTSPRSIILHYADDDGYVCVQQENLKYIMTDEEPHLNPILPTVYTEGATAPTECRVGQVIPLLQPASNNLHTRTHADHNSIFVVSGVVVALCFVITMVFMSKTLVVGRLDEGTPSTHGLVASHVFDESEEGDEERRDKSSSASIELNSIRSL